MGSLCCQPPRSHQRPSTSQQHNNGWWWVLLKTGPSFAVWCSPGTMKEKWDVSFQHMELLVPTPQTFLPSRLAVSWTPLWNSHHCHLPTVTWPVSLGSVREAEVGPDLCYWEERAVALHAFLNIVMRKDCISASVSHRHHELSDDTDVYQKLSEWSPYRIIQMLKVSYLIFKGILPNPTMPFHRFPADPVPSTSDMCSYLS